ncbi:toxin [Proteus mirabilis]|uniref:Toxin n=1 Tax=Proteus mirabilis TaxID=584 RepID=A0A379GEX1_PROMI|nr:toxin [Proteus mirabilis]
MTTVMRIKNEEKITLKGDAGRLTGSYYRGNDNIPEATDKKVVLFLHGSNSPTEKNNPLVFIIIITNKASIC